MEQKRLKAAESIDEEPVPGQNDKKEGLVIYQIAEDEAVDDGSPVIFYHAVFFALFFKSYRGRSAFVLLARPRNKPFDIDVFFLLLESFVDG